MTQLIVALDVASAVEVERVVRTLGPSVGFYKIGLELFSAEGPEVVRLVRRLGKRVFLDLKLHDIPRTVERAVATCASLGVDLLTVHASGGRAMLGAAAAAAAAAGAAAPRIVAVTVLTSLDARDLADLGIAREPAAQVDALGQLALAAGVHGIVCSPQEVGRMRQRLGPAALLVTPGIRPAGTAMGDQKRTATPGQAVADGATHLVVGRPILDAPDPAAAAAGILRDMQGGLTPGLAG